MGVVEIVRNEGVASLMYKTQRKIKRLSIKNATILFNRPFVRSDYDVMLTPNWGDVTFEACLYARYGRFFSNYLRDIEYKFIFVDIGANQGLYSLIAAKNPNCERAICFEPVKSTFRLLKSNITANGLADKIVALNCGLSSEESVVRIYSKPGHSGVASLHNHFGESETFEEVQLSTSSVIEPHIEPGIPLIIKIDTEGHERVVLEELGRSKFAGQISSVFYEVDSGWSDPKTLEVLLRSIGMQRFDQIGSGSHYDVMASRERRT